MSNLDVDDCNYYAIELASHFRDVFRSALQENGGAVRSVLFTHDLINKNKWKSFLPELHGEMIEDFHRVMLLDHPIDAKTRYAALREAITNGNIDDSMWSALWKHPELESARKASMDDIKEKISQMEEEWEDIHIDDLVWDDLEEEIGMLSRALDQGGNLQEVSLDTLKRSLRSLVDGFVVEHANVMLKKINMDPLVSVEDGDNLFVGQPPSLGVRIMNKR